VYLIQSGSNLLFLSFYKKFGSVENLILSSQSLNFFQRLSHLGGCGSGGGGGKAEAPKSVLIELILPNTQEKMGAGITPYPNPLPGHTLPLPVGNPVGFRPYSTKCLSKFQSFSSSTFHLSFAGRMWGAQNRYAPWYRELNIMNRMLNKDDCPESYQNCVARPFSDVFYPVSRIQGIPVIIPETACSGLILVPQPHHLHPPCRDFWRTDP